MSKARIKYFEQEDVLHLVISDEPEFRSVELSPNITVELNDKNEMIGVEILKASAFLRNEPIVQGSEFKVQRSALRVRTLNHKPGTLNHEP
jgi:uncharacterized protein YuzE